MSYLSESSLNDVFPATLTANSVTYTKQSTETLENDSAVLEFQWCLYTESGGDYIIRFCRPDNSVSPVVYYYDQFSSDGGTMSSQQCQTASLASVSIMWNTV